MEIKRARCHYYHAYAVWLGSVALTSTIWLLAEMGSTAARFSPAKEVGGLMFGDQRA